MQAGLAHYHRGSQSYPPPGGTPRYDDAKPWEVVFALSVHPGFPEATNFWNVEVHRQINRFQLARGPTRSPGPHGAPGQGRLMLPPMPVNPGFWPIPRIILFFGKGYLLIQLNIT